MGAQGLGSVVFSLRREGCVTASFDDRFFGLTGDKPFPWQRALYERFARADLGTPSTRNSVPSNHMSGTFSTDRHSRRDLHTQPRNAEMGRRSPTAAYHRPAPPPTDDATMINGHTYEKRN